MNIEEIKKSLENEIISLNDQEKKLGVLNNSFKAFYEKDIDSLIERCEYRIGNLKNAHLYSRVANQEEIDRDTIDLNSAVASLNNEVSDLETIKKNISVSFDYEAYDNISKDLVTIIDELLDKSNKTIKNATSVINNNFDNLEEINEVKEEKKEEVVKEVKEEEPTKVESVEPILNPTEIKTDSLDDLVSDLDKELQPIQEDKKVLEETNQNLNTVPVTNVAPEENIAPVLMPESETPSLNDFLNSTTPATNVTPESEIQSAANVDEGFVKVESVLAFGEEQTQSQAQDGLTLTRRVA